MHDKNSSTIRLFELRNENGLIVKLTNYGARVTSIVTPDRAGEFADVVLGYNSPDEYFTGADQFYLGCTAGRYCNRIAKGRFSIEGAEYELGTNNGPNHLHGGFIGFDKVIWTPRVLDSNAIEFSYRAKDSEEGYPGNLDVVVKFELNNENELLISYRATTDQPTHVNLTNHSYFNLSGEGFPTINDHVLKINADSFTPVDDTCIPTGEIRSVAGTVFDFGEGQVIGSRLECKNEDEQLARANGFDHNWILNRPVQPNNIFGEAAVRTFAASLYEPRSGRELQVFTTEPAIQFYSGNYLDGSLTGKSGQPYLHRSGLCLETQHNPDSPNRPEWPSTLLRPGQTYASSTIYKFGVRVTGD